jgi:cytidyltransferase-like protein
MAYKYSAVICGGTFEHLHEGHKNFLKFAFSISEKVYVTLTSDKYTRMYKPHVASFLDREHGVKKFLEQEQVLERAEIIPIHDIYGIALNKKLDIEALVVTEETVRGAEKVNDKRKSLGMKPLIIEVTPLQLGPIGLPISSTQLRTGMFSSKGELLIKNDLIYTDLHLPQTLRRELQKPFGTLATEDMLSSLDSVKTIAVGDVTTKVLHEHKVRQMVSLVDFVVQREKQEESLEKLGFLGDEVILHANNPPGVITPSLWATLGEAKKFLMMRKEIVLVVNGEEDLAVLPILLEFPFGYTICYGQPGVGMVIVQITQDTKKQAIAILSRFSRDTTRGY